MASLPAAFVERELTQGLILVSQAGSEAAGQGAGASAGDLPQPGERAAGAEGAQGGQVLPHGYTAADLQDKERERGRAREGRQLRFMLYHFSKAIHTTVTL